MNNHRSIIHSITVQTIDPERAAELLGANIKNRNVSPGHVNGIARDMTAGRFMFNGDAIRVATDGTLLDGQHRLHACVKSGVPFQTVLISGLPPETRGTIDGGRKRTMGDRFAMDGVTNAKPVAAVIRGLALYANPSPSALTASEIARVFDRHPGISDSVHLVYSPKTLRHTPRVHLAGLHYIGCHLGRDDDADRFIEVWKTGIPSYEGDAAHVLRERYMRLRGSNAPLGTREMYRMFAVAWQKFIAQMPTTKAVSVDAARIRGWEWASLGLGGSE